MSKGLKILCLGGGPSSLYFSILMKKANPGHDITVIERGDRDSTWGFGVVFSDETLRGFMEADAPSYKRIVEQFAYWGGIDTTIHGKTINSQGHGFCGMSRLKLLNVFHDRCDELGVNLRFNTDISDVGQLDTDAYDLVVAGDGITSILREKYQDEFGTTMDWRANKFCWLATSKPLDDFEFIFRKNEHGWWWVHAYRYEEGTTTWIVETSEKTWAAAGMEHFSEEDTKSAHFSIGSGTKLAMEDGIALASYFAECGNDVQKALDMYQEIRKDEADRLQRTAVVSLSWFEHIDRYAGAQEAEQFTFNMMCRAKRITYDNLRLRDPDFIAGIDKWFAGHVRSTTGFDDVDTDKPTVPVFQPFKIGVNGTPTDWHLMHYGERAVGGAGLLNTEMLCIAPDARITPGCAGIWNDEQVARWRHIVEFVHKNSKAKMCAQVGHAGRKGATCVPWDGGMDQPLPEASWEILAPSPLPYLGHSAVPREMSVGDMDAVAEQFVAAARNVDRAGFDMIEVHLAHGYLLSTFISPYTNHREDEFGGSIENRMKYPLRVVNAMREVWPEEKPMSARISATDWVDGGLSDEDMVAVASMLKEAGIDIINVSTGQVASEEEPIYGRMFQAPFADQIRNEVHIPTIVAGNISTADQANTLVAAGRTDIVAFGRTIMNDPHFVLRAAAHYGHRNQYWPPQYISGKFLADALATKENEEMFELRTAAKPPNPSEALAIAVARGEVLQK
jgi:anthraniloyl-CoA monooxygenase